MSVREDRKVNELMQAYPEAFEDELGWIWTSREAAGRADWTYSNGDMFLEELLGYSWSEACSNRARMPVAAFPSPSGELGG